MVLMQNTDHKAGSTVVIQHFMYLCVSLYAFYIYTYILRAAGRAPRVNPCTSIHVYMYINIYTHIYIYTCINAGRAPRKLHGADAGWGPRWLYIYQNISIFQFSG